MSKNQKLPEGWKSFELGDVVSLSKGKYFPNKDEHLKCLELEHFEKETGRIVGFVDSALQSSCKNAFKKGQVLFGKLRSYLKKYTLASFDGVCSTEIWVLEGDIKNCLNEYLYLLVQTEKFNFIANISTGTHMPRADWKYVSTIPFFFPPVEEQKAIAGTLGIWDAGIEKVSQLIKLKEKQKKAIMQKLLSGKIRLSGFSKPWEEVRLGRIGEISSAGVDKKIVSDEPMVNLLNYMDVYKKNFIYKKDIFWPVSSPISKLKKCNVLAGDIFFTPSSETRDDIANSAVIMEDIPNCVYSYHIVRFRANKEKLFPIFGCYVLKTPQFYKQAYSLCEGSGQRYVISQDEFRNMKITVPADIDEQRAIAGTLSVCDEELALLNKKLALLREQKKSLMQQLLTGKMRLKF